MLFLINHTRQKKQLSLQSNNNDDGTTLSVLVDGYSFPVLTTASNDDLKKEIEKRYGKGELIRNAMSFHNIRLGEGYRQFYYAFERSNNGVAMIAQSTEEDLPERYTASKDVIVVVHNKADVVQFEEDSLTNRIMLEYESDNGEYAVTILPIKWYNWEKLRRTVTIDVNYVSEYRLASIEHKTIPGRRVNTVKPIKKKKEKENKTN